MTVTVMVGVAGSGKSSFVDKRVKELETFTSVEPVVLSSDEYRLKMYKSLEEGNKHNKEVFNTLHADLLKAVKAGKEQIFYDATNLSRRRRRQVYRIIKEVNPYEKVHIVYMTFPRAHIKTLNKLREGSKRVPEDVINKMYANQQPPRLRVDCDSFELDGIPLITTKGANFTYLEEMLPYVSILWKHEINKVYAPHDCLPWHKESIDEHINMAVKNAKDFAPHLTKAALFHDLGKGMTKNLGDDNFATYRNHANISSSYLLNYLYFDSEGVMSEDDLALVELVYQHMNFHNTMGSKNIKNNKLDKKLLEDGETFASIDSYSRIQ